MTGTGLEEGGGPFIRVAKWLALCVALLVAFGTPGGYFYYSSQRLHDLVTAEVNFKSQHIMRLISGNPTLWQFENLRIEDLIKGTSLTGDTELSRVIDRDGNIVAQFPLEDPEFVWPAHLHRQPLFDYGTQVGYLETIHSLKSLYQKTIIVGLFSLLAGLAIYWGLRVVPLRLLKQAWDRVSHLASHDALTDLPNRTTFIDRLQQALAGAKRTGDSVTIYSVDLDYFKDVNDTLGHSAGDQLLIQVAKRMKACLRQEDTLARLGGDEFAIVQPGMGSPDLAAKVAERIIASLKRAFQLDGNEAHIGASIGITICGKDEKITPDQLLVKADLALYRSKSEGRSTYRFFQEEMNAALLERKAIESDLRAALEKNELTLHYQPQVSVSTQRIIGMEALLRWHHPERGNVPPTTIIPIAETSGLMRTLTEWVLRTACRDALKWKPLKVAVNLSPSLFLEDNLVGLVRHILKETGLPPEQLELEITEEVLMTETDRILVTLKELKDIGVHIAMDDFGTGYSSLSYLRKFPFDKIKIDRSFVSEVNENAAAKEIVRAIINMGHALNMNINAEGVEKTEQADLLQLEGCEEIQGYLYGRPMKKDDMDLLLKTTRSIPSPQDDEVSPLRRTAG